MADNEEPKPASKPAPAAAPAAAAAKKGEEHLTPSETSPIFRRVAAAAGLQLADGSHVDRGDLILKTTPAQLLELCTILRDDPELGFDYLCLVTAVDWPERSRRFDLVWTLMSTVHCTRFNLVAEVGENEEVPSVAGIWPTADWHEREAYDMFGVRFSGHPDLRRILLPTWWEGFPLRKDYPLEGRGEHELVVEECLRPRL